MNILSEGSIAQGLVSNYLSMDWVLLDFPHSLKKMSKWGINFGRKGEYYKLFIEPLNPEQLPEKLLHYGAIAGNSLQKGDFNNLRNLRDAGVFGCPDKDFPTYLMDSNPKRQVLTGELYYATEEDNEPLAIKLLINPEVLCCLRSVYADPEGAFHKTLARELGKAFFVLGGIPKDSIIKAEMMSCRKWKPVDLEEIISSSLIMK